MHLYMAALRIGTPVCCGWHVPVLPSFAEAAAPGGALLTGFAH